MIDVIRALVVTLRSDPTLAAMLSTYNGGAAIFPSSPVPESADFPFIVLGSVSDVDHSVKRGEIREVMTDVGVYSEANGNIEAVETPAEYLRGKLKAWESFHLDILRNWSVASANVSGPLVNDQDDQYGRVVTLELLIERQ